eukprot:CCRYP_014227-RA/>CCRYP_014227-RA protein AED:0.36 eAED:0.80 QI:0/0/0/1/1/1/2/0/441
MIVSRVTTKKPSRSVSEAVGNKSMMAWHDDQYLFRLTSTFGWEDAVAFCDALAVGIEQATTVHGGTDTTSSCENYLNDTLPVILPQNRSKSLQEWLDYASSQLFYQDQWGNTPLHAASYVQPPLMLIDALFRVGRVLWKHRTDRSRVPIWAVPSKDASTPFLVACSTGATTSVLQCFLDEVDYYIDENWVDRCARTLVLQPDNQGTTPLMGWISFHRDWIAHLDLHPINPKWELSLIAYLRLAIRMVWCATMDVYPEYPSSNPMLVQRCALIAPYCPVFMMQWLMLPREYRAEVYVPEQECAATRDNTVRRATLSPLIGYQNQKLETNRNEIIKTLLSWYPKAAGEPFPNGRSPLCEAIGRGGYWHSIADPITDPDASGLIQILYNHAPDQLLERDTVTGLFPFMLAAATVPSLGGSQTGVLDTIYNLLRNDPQPVCLSIS